MTKPIAMSREERNASNRAKRAANRDEANAKRRAYYATHKVELAAINRRWDEANQEQRKAARRKWHANSNNKEYMRKWTRSNPERMNEYGRKSYHKNKERTKPIRAARAAARRGTVGIFTYADIQIIFDRQEGCCTGCARSFSNVLPATVDHIMPLSRGGTSWTDNIQLMCMSCNDSKGARTMDEWLEQYLEAA